MLVRLEIQVSNSKLLTSWAENSGSDDENGVR